MTQNISEHLIDWNKKDCHREAGPSSEEQFEEATCGDNQGSHLGFF